MDDGKTTLIGRLLYESGMMSEDQLEALETEAEGGPREETRFCAAGRRAGGRAGARHHDRCRVPVLQTDRRKLIVADTPGHEQYTANMVTGASTADLAVILIDARKGAYPNPPPQFLVSLIWVFAVVLAVNKMDLVGYPQARSTDNRKDHRSFASRSDSEDIEPIPLSALKGDNVVEPSNRMPWYRGPTPDAYLETVPIAGQT